MMPLLTSQKKMCIFVTTFFLIIGIVFPLDIILNASGAKAPGVQQRVKFLKVRWARLIDGKTGPSLENSFKHASFWVQGICVYYNELSYLWFGRVPAEIFIGANHWIFLTNQITEWQKAEFNSKVTRAVSRIEDVVKQLQNSGTLVSIVLVPDRSRIYQDSLPQHALPPHRQAFLQAVVDQLRQKKIDVVSLAPDLQQKSIASPSLFYRDDHHWTYAGAAVSAKVTASHLKTVWALPPATGVNPYSVDWVGGDAHQGSLSYKLNFVQGGKLDRKFSDPEPEARFQLNEQQLKATEGPDVYVLTTSFGMHGFPEFLSNELGFNLTSMIGEGKSSFYTPAQFISQVVNGAGASGHPYGVVWEVQEYHLYRDDLIDGFAIPRSDKRKLHPVIFHIENGRGTSGLGENRLRVDVQRGQFTIRLESPSNFIRLVASSSAVQSRAYIRLLGEKDQSNMLIFDGRGLATYDFHVEKPQKEFVFGLDYAGGKASFEISQIMMPEQTESSVTYKASGWTK